MPYDPNVPTGLLNLDVDYRNLQQNFSAINVTYGVDHVPLTNGTGVPPAGINGMHTVVHLVEQMADPTPAATSSGELYSKKSQTGTDIQLFYESFTGVVQQISGNRRQTNGNAWVGGILVMWGFEPRTTSGIGTVSFAGLGQPNFPNNIWNVQATGVFNGGTPIGFSTAIIDQDPLTFLTTGFRYNFVSSNGSPSGFFWVAIGN